MYDNMTHNKQRFVSTDVILVIGSYSHTPKSFASLHCLGPSEGKTFRGKLPNRLKLR